MKSLLTLTLLSTAGAVSARKHHASAQAQPQLQNANHIFNAIHSSMRQFGSSLNHNGMSVFLATVPEDTEFYHGTSSKYRVNGTEWLAFEPEHALMFARAHGPGGPGGGRGPPSGGPPPDGEDAMPRVMRDHEEVDFLPPPPPPDGRKEDLRRDTKAQHPIDGMVESKPDLAPNSANDEEPAHGYLHTYRTKHPLRLLYVDGQSAAKSQKGTLDVQDLVLLHHDPPTTEDRLSPTDPHHDGEEPHRDEGERERQGIERHDNDDNRQGRPPRRPQHDMPGPPHDMLGLPHDMPGPPHDILGPPHDEPKGDPHGGEGQHRPEHNSTKGHDGHDGGEREPERPDERPPPDGRDHKRPDEREHQRPDERQHKRPGEHRERPHEREHQRPDTHERPDDRDHREGTEPQRTKGGLHAVNLPLMQDAEHKDPLSAQENKQPTPPHHGPLGEGERAERMCRLAHEEYDDRIDGIIRMEGGFEIILCNFAKDLDVVQIAQTQESGSRGGPGMGPPSGRDGREGFNMQLAVSARYDGIGGNRVHLNYDNFVSLFAYEEAVYFDDTGRPRVNNETAAIDPIRKAIKHLALKPAKEGLGKDWQAVADMIVTRYTERIAYLASGDLEDLTSFKAEADRALRPFIDYSDRNSTREIARCASQFLPLKTSSCHQSLAEASVRNVTTVLCRTLSAANEVDTLTHGLSMIRALKSWLAWTSWKQCHCAEHEICFLPIWPQGSAEDFEQPQCKSAGDISQGRGGYWGGFGRPHNENRAPDMGDH
ncbi:hypothetical protein LTR85_011749 [Meristemomyces frigidus]|nr:hypothetical protein LTR85_011749 [Meristemomyces frigidus]